MRGFSCILLKVEREENLTESKNEALEAIVAAFNDRYELCGPFDDDWQELCLAAALRVAIEQVVPSEPNKAMYFTNEAIRLNRMGIRSSFLAIAAELENHKSNI